MNFLYYNAYQGQWRIGPTEGGDLIIARANSSEICAKALEKTDWVEFDGTQWNKLETAQVKCLDNIDCACRNLDITGFQIQRNCNGQYELNHTIFDGRKCFAEKKLFIRILTR